MDEDPRAAITACLRAIEREHGVAVLMAVEWGSQAWGFPSRDSDFDVRFFYARPAGRYLSVVPLRDVIELPFDPPLDIGGWDLRKAARLLCRSNATVVEWAASPIRYVANDGLAGRLVALAAEVADPAATRYHYDRMARRAWTVVAASDRPPLKRYCYALGAALAKRWIDEARTPSPMGLPSLLRGPAVEPAVPEAAEALVAAKLEGDEDATGPRVPALNRLIEGQLRDRAVHPGPVSPPPEAVARADALVRAFLPDDAAAQAAIGGTGPARLSSR